MASEFYTSPDGEWIYETYIEGEPESDEFDYEYDVEGDFEEEGNKLFYIEKIPKRKIVLSTNVSETILQSKQGKVKIRKKRRKPPTSS